MWQLDGMLYSPEQLRLILILTERFKLLTCDHQTQKDCELMDAARVVLATSRHFAKHETYADVWQSRPCSPPVCGVGPDQSY